MDELLSAAQMRAIEGAAIERGDVGGLELMERAGRGVVDAVFEAWPELAGAPTGSLAGGAVPGPPGCLEKEEGARRAVVLCGPGNNGGDGFVVARLLKAHGWAVDLFLYGDAERLPADARVMCARWREAGEVRALDPGAIRASGADLFVDAFFGTGLSRPVPEPVYWALAAAGEACAGGRARLVAVDLPSWICSDSGRVLGTASYPDCDLAVSFHRLKLGHVLAAGPMACGRAVVADIGLAGAGEGAVTLVRIAPGDAPDMGKADGHKYAHGHALILAGGAGHGGAGRLAARAALRVGAGLVTLACPPEALGENAAQLNAIMLREVADGTALSGVLADARLNAICLGPGLGRGARTRDLVRAALGGDRQVVLDADALTSFADDPEALFELTRAHASVVMTPHAGEFARLFADIAARLAAAPMTGPAFSKVDAARAAAARAGCVVLFKGPDTVIADARGRCSVNVGAYERAAPWLATAGSGDVLAGIIAGLGARGFAPMQAAETAAWLHVDCALRFGPGLIAEDLPEQLPAVFRALGL